MTNTTNTTNTIESIIVETVGTMGGDVFFGSFKTKIKDKIMSVMVSNHIKDTNKKYEFRVASKCRAGFVSMHDHNDYPRNVIAGYKKNALVNVQVKTEYGHWMNVFTTKSGKWYGIDKGFLEVMTVGDMRTSHPDMCDSQIWERMGAKTWADKAFTKN